MQTEITILIKFIFSVQNDLKLENVSVHENNEIIKIKFKYNFIYNKKKTPFFCFCFLLFCVHLHFYTFLFANVPRTRINYQLPNQGNRNARGRVNTQRVSCFCKVTAGREI